VSAGHYKYVKVSGGHFELEDTIKCYIFTSVFSWVSVLLILKFYALCFLFDFVLCLMSKFVCVYIVH